MGSRAGVSGGAERSTDRTPSTGATRVEEQGYTRRRYAVAQFVSRGAAERSGSRRSSPVGAAHETNRVRRVGRAVDGPRGGPGSTTEPDTWELLKMTLKNRIT